MTDPIADLKARQREGWASFAPLEMVTTPTAARLVRFAGVKPGQRVLDVGCGTGVVAITARRVGASAVGVDLTPDLLARAKEHGGVAGYEDVAWKEGDVEALPFADGEFDVVLSQFGHMFAPRPDVATKEMLRVLRPGGTIAFSTWPPELGIGKLFALVGGYGPPLPPGASPPPQWGDVATVRQRLGDAVRDVAFDREAMLFPAMSVGHYRELLERTSGPVLKLVQSMRSDPARLAKFRAEMEAALAPYFEPEGNVVRQGYLMTRATKA
ncbi:MAG TPA: methyltransferase domain-containing protein [Candidatus Thermoplasmatota archaeon]|nr:methyltransferase domain-containing protein [Candidatus Thermoplasmatota archaeon]